MYMIYEYIRPETIMLLGMLFHWTSILAKIDWKNDNGLVIFLEYLKFTSSIFWFQNEAPSLSLWCLFSVEFSWENQVCSYATYGIVFMGPNFHGRCFDWWTDPTGIP